MVEGKAGAFLRPGPLAGPVVAIALAAALLLGCAGDDSSTTASAQLPPVHCARTIGPGTDLTDALAEARPDSVLCLRGGSYRGGRIPAEATDKDDYVTMRAKPDAKPVFKEELVFDNARYLRIEDLSFRQGLAFVPAASHVQLIGNDFSGPGGIFFFGDGREGGHVGSVLIEGNRIHDIDYTGSQETYRGYGIKSIGSQHGFTVKDNTIQSVAADYLQTDTANDWTVEGNRFLGPTLVGGHPEEHQDLWQDYAGGRNIKFVGNVARHTGTAESLLFQMTYPGDHFSRVVVANNLFDHDSRGYSCQIYQSSGLIFRHNTVVGSHWGCLFRDDDRYPGGSRYTVERNVFVDTADGRDLSTEGGASDWGSFDYNVSSDATATGRNSVRRWRARWEGGNEYLPVGLPFPAGYRPPN